MRFSYLSILLLILLPILLFFLTRGVVTHDEGYILHSSERMLYGQFPFRDFHFVYTPLSIMATSISFSILGPSILSSRILILVIYMLSSFLLFKTILIATKNKLYATIAVLLFAAWGPTHVNFSWPVVFAIFTAFMANYFLMKFMQLRHERYLFFAGFSCFLVFLAKQNFGAAIILPIIVFFLVKHARSWRYLFSFIYGYVWAFIFFMVYLLATQSVPQFINDFYIFTIKRVVINEGLSTNFIYQDTFLKMLFRTALYISPVVLSFSSFILLYIRRRFHLLYLPVFVAIFYLVGIRPTTDYIHLTPLLSLIGIPIALYLRYNISSTVRMALLFFSIFMIFLGFQTAIFKGYYRWDSPLITNNLFFKNPKVNIFLNEKFNFEFTELIQIANTYTKSADYIYVNSYNPMLYFVMNRKEPTKHNFLAAGVVPDEYYREVLGNLVAKKIKVLILDYKSLDSLPIKSFIKKHYYYLKTVQDFDVYILNP